MQWIDYIKFSRRVKAERGWECQLCGKINKENKQSKKPIDKIVCHHIHQVKYKGVTSPMLTNRSNILVVCQFCHLVRIHRQSLSRGTALGFYFHGWIDGLKNIEDLL